MGIAPEHRLLSATVSHDAVTRLRSFRQAVERHYPERVVGVVLFGSRARGDATRDSDYDVAVFVKDLEDRRSVDHVLADLAYPHILAGVHIRPVALPDLYRTTPQRGALALDIARDGVAVN